MPIDTDDGRPILRDEDNVALGLVADYEHGILGRLRQFGQLIRLSDTPGAASPCPHPWSASTPARSCARSATATATSTPSSPTVPPTNRTTSYGERFVT